MLRHLTLLLLALIPAGTVRADIVVFGHPQVEAEELSRAQVRALYMGRDRSLPSGVRANPIDLQSGAAPRAVFYRELVRRSESQVDAWWASLVFSGRASPLTRVATVDEMLAAVREDPSAIGFVRAENLPPDLKVLLRLESDDP